MRKKQKRFKGKSTECRTQRKKRVYGQNQNTKLADRQPDKQIGNVVVV